MNVLNINVSILADSKISFQKKYIRIVYIMRTTLLFINEQNNCNIGTYILL